MDFLNSVLRFWKNNFEVLENNGALRILNAFL